MSSLGLSKASSMAKAPKKDEIASDLSQKEAEERRDAILKRMLKTPPKPRKGKGGAKEVKK